MFKQKSLQEQITELSILASHICDTAQKTKADMEYLAMMSDIELDEEEEENAEE